MPRWIEFADKQVAKRLAGSLNGTDMGGKHFSTHRYDLWNLKYLKHFKWDNLTAEIGALPPLWCAQSSASCCVLRARRNPPSTASLRLPSHRFGGGGNGAAYQKAVREQKLAAELRNAKRERDSYLARVDKAHAIDAMVLRPA